MEFDAIYTVKKEIEKEEFLRQLLIDLGTNSETPVDVTTATLGQVEESVKEVVLCTVKVDGSCTASIGYDRQETYWTKEKKYNSDTHDYYYVDVEKTRTVTDWRPFQQSYSEETADAAFNDHSGSSDKGILTALTTAEKDSIVVKGEAEVCNEGLDKAVSLCKEYVENNAVSFPGDHHKDVSYSSNTTITRISCYKLPFYSTDYTYKDKKYNASCFACGNLTIRKSAPANDVDITAETKAKTKNLRLSKNIAWCAFVVMYILTFYIGARAGLAWLSLLPPVPLAAAIYFNYKHNKEYVEFSQSLSSDIGAAKIAALKQALIANNFRELSNEEASGAEAKSLPCPDKPKKFGILAFLCAVITIITIIAMFSAIS